MKSQLGWGREEAVEVVGAKMLLPEAPPPAQNTLQLIGTPERATRCPQNTKNIHSGVMRRAGGISSSSTLSPRHAPRSPLSPACGRRCSGNSCCSPHCPWCSPGQGQRSRGEPPGCRRRRRSSALPCEEEEEVFHCFGWQQTYQPPSSHHPHVLWVVPLAAEPHQAVTDPRPRSAVAPT